MLHEFQSRFAAALAAPTMPAPPPALGGDAERRKLGLKVYRNNSAHARVTALKDTYPAILRLVGEDCMKALALDLARKPLETADARVWTAQLPEFITSTPLAADLPYLADVAKIERAWLHAYHADDPDPVTMDAETLAESVLKRAPSTTVCRSDHDAFAIWQTQHGTTTKNGAHCIVYRNQMQVIVEPLSDSSATHIAALETEQHALDWLAALEGDDVTQALAGRLLAAGAILCEGETS